MWVRLKRLFRSIFGGIIDNAEDPDLILQQLIRDMNDQVPKMRENVALVMATEKRLAREIESSQVKLTDIDNKIKAAIRTGHDDIATALIGEMQTVQRGLDTAKQNFEQAKVASAKTMSSFQVGDDSQTFGDMREKIANRAAAAEAKAELASSGLDTRMQSIEKEMAQIEAEDKLLAYKQQLGMLPDATRSALPEAGVTSTSSGLELLSSDPDQLTRRKLSE